MQLLGIGLNGHIGFNEPGESFEKMTHCVELTQSTKDANQRLFKLGEKVPEKAFTMGIKSIMQSKHILLIASGANKAEIVKEAFFGPVTPKVPASILQLHNHVTVIVDKDAAKYNITEKTGKLISIQAVTDENDLMIINRSGLTIRTAVDQIRVAGRATQGVRIINLREGDAIASVIAVPANEEEEPAVLDGAGAPESESEENVSKEQ